MADTTKALKDKITQLQKKYATKKAEWMKLQTLINTKKGEFYEAGHTVNVANDPEGKKLLDEITKIQHQYDKLGGEVNGLNIQIKTTQTALDQYVDQKADLKQAKTSGAIDKDEYTKRKSLCKEMLKDVGKVRESEIHKLNERADAKKKELATLATEVEKATSVYTDAKKFVEKDFTTGDAKQIADKCQKYFGKRNLNPAEARTALKKLEDGLKELQKDKRVLTEEVALVSAKVKEGVSRIGAFQQDIQRSLVSFQDGNMDQKELDRVMANFKKSLAIK